MAAINQGICYFIIQNIILSIYYKLALIASTGVKESTDINSLAEIYLRLSYHGLRAKDKSFNAEMKTDFDDNIGKINIISQDIGRVLLNLYNNAFYAVNQQKSKNLISFAKEVTPFEKVLPLNEPTVSVSTKKSDNHVTNG